MAIKKSFSYPGMDGEKGPVIFRDDSLGTPSERSTRSGSAPVKQSRGRDAGALDRAGIRDSGYINTNRIDSGLDARFNRLSPGMNIEDQKTADIHAQPFKVFRGYGPDGVCTEEATWKTVDSTKGSSRNRGK